MTCPSCATELELDAAFCGECGFRTRRRRESLVGMTLDDRYQVDAKIAAGGFGSIYRATHLATGMEVALKVLHADLASDDGLAARFRREGTAIASLRSPNTVHTYELGEAADGTLYIAMELLHGENLYQRFCARGPLGYRDVLAIITGICRSLDEAHAAGIVHRDLKPANIHLGPYDFVKLLDFGVAKVITGSALDDGSELTRIGQTIGTLEYMSPEQIVGGDCDARSDIYQLGVLAYEMITGQRPFADATGATSLITALLTQSPPPPSTLFACACVPREVDAVILRCLEREPEHRFQNVHELAAAIDHALSLPQPAHVERAPRAPSMAIDEDATWIGSAGAAFESTYAQAPIPPRVTALGPVPKLEPVTLPTFDVPVRGSTVDSPSLDPPVTDAIGRARARGSAVPQNVDRIGEQPFGQHERTVMERPSSRRSSPKLAQGTSSPPMTVPVPVAPHWPEVAANQPEVAANQPEVAPNRPEVAAGPVEGSEIDRSPVAGRRSPVSESPRIPFAVKVAAWVLALSVLGATTGAALAALVV